MTDTALAPALGTASLTGLAPSVARDYTIEGVVGTLTAAGFVPRLYPEGQTTAAAETTRRCAPRVPLSGAMNALPLTVTLSLYDLVKDCQAGLGFIPGGVTLVGFMVESADLDDGGTAIVQSIVLDATTLVTGITTGRAGTKGIYPCVPTAVTTPTVLYLKTTTAPTTAAVGAVTVTALYYA